MNSILHDIIVRTLYYPPTDLCTYMCVDGTQPFWPNRIKNNNLNGQFGPTNNNNNIKATIKTVKLYNNYKYVIMI